MAVGFCFAKSCGAICHVVRGEELASSRICPHCPSWQHGGDSTEVERSAAALWRQVAATFGDAEAFFAPGVGPGFGDRCEIGCQGPVGDEDLLVDLVHERPLELRFQNYGSSAFNSGCKLAIPRP